MNHELFDCKAIPQIEMEFMNTVHCEELQMVATLVESLETREASEEVDQCLTAWLVHTREHFEREERLMDEYRFPPYPVHKMEHEEAYESLITAQQHWSDTHDYDALQHYIEQQWRSWFQQHVLSMDRVTANYFNRMGVEVQL